MAGHFLETNALDAKRHTLVEYNGRLGVVTAKDSDTLWILWDGETESEWFDFDNPHCQKELGEMSFVRQFS